MPAKSGLPIETIVRLRDGVETLPGGRTLGYSKEGRPVLGFRLGSGPRTVSLIAGCHADEPVGPWMLETLTGWLTGEGSGSSLLERCRLLVVPRVNPDGDTRNRPWTDHPRPLIDSRGEPDWGYDPERYLRSVVREPPGDDVEFGFPRRPGDAGARPENLAVADFLAPWAPFVLHASFHGMGLAPGPWFLIEGSWAERSGTLREELRRSVAELGYDLHDPDRGGEKGFFRIDAGFTTRPDSRAMAAHFEALGDQATAALFRPSSMEHVRSLGGDPFTFVSEMPLFLVPAEHAAGRPGGRLKELARTPAKLGAEFEKLGIRPMPIRDQMRLQLRFLEEGLRLVGLVD